MNVMKNKLIYFVVMLFALGLTSCYEEEEYADNLSLGATIDVSGDNAFILGQTTEVGLTIMVNENPGAPVESIILSKQLLTASGNSEVVTQTLTPNADGEIDLTFNNTQLFEDVPVGGAILTPNDLGPGDGWKFNFAIKMSDGRELKPGRGADSFSVNFTCESDLAGTYDTVTDGGTGDGSGGTASPFSGLAYQVTITEVSAGVYEVSDITFGLYPVGYGDGENPAQFTDICNSITVTDQPDVVYGGDVFNGTGTVNGDGTITISWSNGYGDNGVTTLTKV